MTQTTIKPPTQRKPIMEAKKTTTAAPKPARIPTHEEITERARTLWETRGRPIGQDDEIWLEAEAQLKKGH
jgi:hypothetical protein